MRKEFHLPEEDTEYLDTLGCQWETISNGGNWLLLHDYPVPSGYNTDYVSLALRIDAGYPNSQIDMMYFKTHLSRLDGKPIGALATMQIDGGQWQRWSRHRTGQNPWRAGVDNVSTHLSLVNHLLEREFTIR